MINKIAIRADGLSKQYRIGRSQNGDQRFGYRALRDVLTDSVTAPFRRVAHLLRGQAYGAANLDHTIWALKDVSFEVQRGEVVGIIGRNGAGKSTLLKILSRITKPTEGEVAIYGRIGSLLEVGTGFHPELTGRENIFLNGAILGMKRTDIARLFDEIVAFAEVEKFIDTPVKHFSSGMYLRLAFAVAAHLEPEILLVDEVLAVGDLQFQKKCLGKMEDVGKDGRTVLFVSHQLNAIRKLCRRCLWLDDGQIHMAGPTAKVVSAYETALLAPPDPNNQQRQTHLPARFLRWEIVEAERDQFNVIDTLGAVTLKVVVEINKTVQGGIHGISIRNADHQLVWGWAEYNLNLEPGIHEFTYAFPTLPLRPGVYSMLVSLDEADRRLDIWNCVPGLIIATEPLTHPVDRWAGVLNIPCAFEARQTS